MTEYEVTDIRGTFRGTLVHMWMAGCTLMVTFEVTEVGRCYSAAIAPGDRWSIVIESILSIRGIK